MEGSIMKTHRIARRPGALALAAAALILLGAPAVPADDLAQALDALGQARAELKLSKNDAGGHRMRAMKRIDDAVAALDPAGQHAKGDDHASAPASTKQGHMRRAVTLLQEAKKAVNAASVSNATRKQQALDAIQRALLQTRRGIEAGLADENAGE
jgi:hypothetical protein